MSWSSLIELYCTHRSFFNDSVEHYNSLTTLFPDHQPEMATSVSQWTLKT